MKKVRGWKRTNSKLAYGNPWIKVYEDDVERPDGKKGIYGFLEKPASNFIIALDRDDSVFFIN